MEKYEWDHKREGKNLSIFKDIKETKGDDNNKDFVDTLLIKDEFVLRTTKHCQKKCSFWFATSVSKKPNKYVLPMLEGMILYAI